MYSANIYGSKSVGTSSCNWRFMINLSGSACMMLGCVGRYTTTNLRSSMKILSMTGRTCSGPVDADVITTSCSLCSGLLQFCTNPCSLSSPSTTGTCSFNSLWIFISNLRCKFLTSLANTSTHL